MRPVKVFFDCSGLRGARARGCRRSPAPRRRSSAGGCSSASANRPSLKRCRPPARRAFSPPRALACATTSPEASTISVPASRIERSECVPLPEAIFAVSPPMKTMSSGCTPSRSAITCAKLVSWPWPVDCVPTASSTLPAAEHGDLDALVRDADRRLDIVGDADAAQLAALLATRACAPAKPFQSAAVEHALHVAGEVAAVVEQPAGGAVGQLLARDQVLLAQLRRGRCRAASAARSISRSSTSVASGRPAPRNGAVGTVLVITERQRMCISGMS